MKNYAPEYDSVVGAFLGEVPLSVSDNLACRLGIYLLCAIAIIPTMAALLLLLKVLVAIKSVGVNFIDEYKSFHTFWKAEISFRKSKRAKD